MTTFVIFILSVVGMGFRPQPRIDDNLIQVTDNKDQQESIASSLQLYRQGEQTSFDGNVERNLLTLYSLPDSET
jgi:hypothetical protein